MPFLTFKKMSKIPLLLLIITLNVAASDCYVIGDDFTIKKDYSGSVKNKNGNLEGCEDWKMIAGVANIISPSGNYERNTGEYLVSKKSNSYFASFISFATGESDKVHEGVQQFGDGIDLFYMPFKGYLSPTKTLELDINQFFYEDSVKKTFLIKKFLINNNAKYFITNNQIIITNLKQGKDYRWIAYDQTNEKSTGSFTVYNKVEEKDYKDDLTENLKKINSNNQVTIDLLKARVMYDWDLYYDSRKLITNYIKQEDL